MDDWRLMIDSACPLPSRHALWDDLSLVLSGPEWGFTCTSPWRVVSDERMIAGWEDAGAAATIAGLDTLQVVGCETLVRLSSGDLRLVLANGHALLMPKYTEWEMRLLYDADRMGDVTFMSGGRVVPNPF